MPECVKFSYQLTALQNSLSKLTPREFAILSLRYGIDGKGIHTLEEVGALFLVTRERIRQIEAKALRKIRYHYNRTKGNKSEEAKAKYENVLTETRKLIEADNKKPSKPIILAVPEVKQAEKERPPAAKKKKPNKPNTYSTPSSINPSLYYDIKPATDYMDNNRKIRIHIIFTGQVQGVNFLWRAWKAADLYKCTGWCRNAKDGSVIMEIQGSEEAINNVIQNIKDGKYVEIHEMITIQITTNPHEKGFQTY